VGRFALHRLGRCILRIRSTKYSFDVSRIALVIAPHPDDEAFGCGGLIARKRLAGQPVHIVFVTDGSLSHPHHPTLTPNALVALRENEARESLRTLEVDSDGIHFLDIRDGSLAHLSAADSTDLTERLRLLLRTIKADEIFLPSRRDGSSEHEAVFRLLQSALREISPLPRVFEFPVWSWWNPFLLLRDCLATRRVLRVDLTGCVFLKRAAIACHRSQVEPCPPWTQPVQSADFTRLFLCGEEYYYEN
jgi:LmbE family N-acetylglucosaminyl deacetylase